MESVRGLRVYLSGPITGIECCNRPAFHRAKKWLLACGARRVFDPTDMSPKIGETPKPHEHYMRACIRELTTRAGYDLIVLLPGWEKSAGAVVEAHVARALGMRTYVLKTKGDER